jgi:hypothetical protein
LSDEPVVDEVNIGTAMKLLSRKDPPMATCPKDDEPLVATLEFRGAEFYCVVCHTKYGFLSPKPAESTPLLEARLDELKVLYKLEREERKKLLGS